jgi:hypothetical protein
MLHYVEAASWVSRLEPCLDQGQDLVALLVRGKVDVRQVGNPAEVGSASCLVGLGVPAAGELWRDCVWKEVSQCSPVMSHSSRFLFPTSWVSWLLTAGHCGSPLHHAGLRRSLLALVALKC